MSDFMTISINAALTLATGKGMDAEFGEVHRAAEHLLGHPIWTHELAEPQPWERMRKEILRQHPELDAFDVPEGDNAAAKQSVRAATKLLGSEVVIKRGGGHRTEHPIESLRRIAPDKPVIGVFVDSEDRDE